MDIYFYPENSTTIIELFLHPMHGAHTTAMSTKLFGALPPIQRTASKAHDLIKNDPETNHGVVGIPL